MKQINIRTFDLNLLRVLIALADTGSVSKAATTVGLSQPATSNALARLRDATGDRLFVRTKDGMAPTTYAESILPGVRTHLVGLFSKLTGKEGFDPKTSIRTFSLSLSGLGEMIFLPRLLQNAMRLAPNIRFENVSSPASNLAGELQNGNVDCAIGLIQIKDRGIRSRRLFYDTYVVVAGRGLKRDPSSLEELRQEKIAVSAPAASYGADVARLLKAKGLADGVAIRLANFGALAELLDDQPLVSIVPKQYADLISKSGKGRILPISLNHPRSVVSLIWHERTENDPACIWLRSLMLELYRSKAES